MQKPVNSNGLSGNSPAKPNKPKSSATVKGIVHVSMRWLSLIILGALAVEGAKYLVRGDASVREALAALVVILLFYVHLA